MRASELASSKSALCTCKINQHNSVGTKHKYRTKRGGIPLCTTKERTQTIQTDDSSQCARLYKCLQTGRRVGKITSIELIFQVFHFMSVFPRKSKLITLPSVVENKVIFLASCARALLDKSAQPKTRRSKVSGRTTILHDTIFREDKVFFFLSYSISLHRTQTVRKPESATRTATSLTLRVL